MSGGGAFRSSPDWGPGGIIYVETVAASGPQLVLVDETGGNRRVLVTGPAGFDISYPHWIKATQ